jgi:hypothetical protein
VLANASASLNQAIKVLSGHGGTPRLGSVGSILRQTAWAAGDATARLIVTREERHPMTWLVVHGRLWRWRGSTCRRTKQTSRASRHSVTGGRFVRIRSMNHLLQVHTARQLSDWCHMLPIVRKCACSYQ